MASFDDLVFEPHSLGLGVIAKMMFPNGYGVSVIQGPFFYTNGTAEYELAVCKDGNLAYETPITDDVLGHLTRDEVTEIMQRVESLDK